MRPREESFAAARARELGISPEALRRAREDRKAPKPMSAAELLGQELPPVRWAVPGVLPEGVTILAGKPKMGKSWFGLGVGVSIAAGGHALGKIAVEQGGALYLGLEDNKRRLQRRLKKVLAGRPAPKGMEVYWEWPRLDEGGAEALATYLAEHSGTRLVVLDTLKKIRSREGSGRRGVYDLDYEALEPLLPLAAEYGVAILVVHHLRKLEAGDPLDMISGSTGLTGGVDGALVLKRDRGKQDATLMVDGRDIEEPSELALRWDADIASWSLMGDAEEFRLSNERQAVLDALRSAGVPLAPKEIAERIDKPDGNVRKLLHGMRDDGQVTQLGSHPRYKYIPAGNDGNDGNDGNNGNDSNDTDVTGRGMGGNDKSGENPAYLSGSHRNDTNVTVVTRTGNDMHSEDPPEAREAKEGQGSNTSSKSPLSSSSSASGGDAGGHVVGASGARLSAEEFEQVKRLAAQGHMSYAEARRAVLAKHEPRRRGFSDLSPEKGT